MHVQGKNLSEEQLDSFLQTRIDGTIGCPEAEGIEPFTFEIFAECFAATSGADENGPFVLMIADPQVRKLPIQSYFPSNYRPTVREVLDIIADDTCAQWRYVTEGNARLGTSLQGSKKFLDALVLFKFTESAGKFPLTWNTPSTWTSKDECCSVICMPPGWKPINNEPITYAPMELDKSVSGQGPEILSVVPWGLKVQSVGTYSADAKTEEAALLSRIAIENSIELASSVRPGVTDSMLKRTKIGNYDGWYFESPISPRSAKSQGNLIWRQWVFIAGRKCYRLTSCIPKHLDDEIYPTIARMVDSIRPARNSQSMRFSTTSNVCEGQGE